MILRKAVIYLMLPALALGAGGCFTGVESTPRIKLDDVKREGAATVSPEHDFLADVQAQAPAAWQRGKRFLVANDRISLIFTTASADTRHMTGTVLEFDSFRPARSLTGDDGGELVFTTGDGRSYFYRVPGLSKERFDTIANLAVPFTVDLGIVAKVDSAMRGKRYFVRTPAWYDATTRMPVNGLRQIEVEIDSVGPGDENFVAAVYFHATDSAMLRRTAPAGEARMLFMSTGSGRAATRNFDTLFSFTDPRKSYPEIKDDVWEYIVASKLREGMTRVECRLALGAPHEVLRTPTYGGMREHWSYSDGVYLIFDDGYLTRFRQ